MSTHTTTAAGIGPTGAGEDFRRSVQEHDQSSGVQQQRENNTTNGNSREIAASAVHKLPPFWTHNPKLWFVQIESVFALAGVTRDETKFQYVIANMDPQITETVSHIIFNPPSNISQYKAIKEALLTVYGESDDLRLRKLLSGQSLGDNRPTQFLQRLRNLSSGQIGDSVLKSIFLEQMPEQIRTILAVADSSLSILAEQADKIFNVLKPSDICAVKYMPDEKKPISETSMKQLSDQIKSLEDKIKKLEVRRERSLSQDRGKRRRSVSRNREWCWYHNRFGKDSTKCTSPCSHPKN